MENNNFNGSVIENKRIAVDVDAKPAVERNYPVEVDFIQEIDGSILTISTANVTVENILKDCKKTENGNYTVYYKKFKIGDITFGLNAYISSKDVEKRQLEEKQKAEQKKLAELSKKAEQLDMLMNNPKIRELLGL